MTRTLQYLLLGGILLSLILMFTGFPSAGALTLILTPLIRNFIFGIFSFIRGSYLLAFLAFFTIAIILFT